MTDRGLIDDPEAWDRTFNAVLKVRESHLDAVRINLEALLNVERWLVGAGVLKDDERTVFTRQERRLTGRKGKFTI